VFGPSRDIPKRLARTARPGRAISGKKIEKHDFDADGEGYKFSRAGA
jgi:hypothetical protein